MLLSPFVLTIFFITEQVFSRVLSSSRRKAELDRLNASMYAALSEAVNAVGSGWQHINAAEPPFIDDILTNTIIWSFFC